MKKILLFSSICFLLACRSGEERAPSVENDEPLSELPFTDLLLEDLSAFRPTADNWSISGSVLSDHTEEKHLVTEAGKGVLVNQPDENHFDNLFTNTEHGDLELKLEAMIPKGSNSGIYLQGRYEIQLFDSWQKETPGFSDCGGIYQRWDESRPEGERGFEGHPPVKNATKAPGLWQELHIIFRAPRFDAAGNKVQNAVFEKVILNDVLIHEMVEVTGPTRAAAFLDEAPTGPLMIQGDHGPVALRNISYKRYFDTSKLTLKDLRYQYFEIDGPITELPDFNALQVVKEGATDSLVYQTLSERNERVAYIFSGQLDVAKKGDYLFTVFSDDGSQLFIHDALLIDNDGKHDYEPKSGLIHLSEGLHDFKLTYFNNNWGQGLTLFYEGPEIRSQPLVSRLLEKKAAEPTPITLEPGESPEMVRSFLMHGGKKLTHTISVGDPTGLHYSVDLRRGSPLQVWRGKFADVTEMLHNRGQPQLLHPMEMTVHLEAGLLAAVMDNVESPYPTQYGPSLHFLAYDIDEMDRPVFSYLVNDATLTDRYGTDTTHGEIQRTISVDSPVANLYTRLASGEYIKAVGNGYFSVGGRYYIRLLDTKAEPLIRSMVGREEMLFSFTENSRKIAYAILW